MMQTELPSVLQGALVAAVDDSPPAREALRYAARLAAEAGKPLHVLTVWNFVSGAPPAQDQDTPPTAEAWQAEAQRRLEALLAEELPDRRDVLGEVVVLHGNTVPVLLEVTKMVDHLVVGSRGRGGFRGLLLGSTSEQLVRHAECPVTVVRHGCTAG
jgi:nucleotide-binding universal stress UspA family protein